MRNDTYVILNILDKHLTYPRHDDIRPIQTVQAINSRNSLFQA
jgi:hypothetical protein